MYIVLFHAGIAQSVLLLVTGWKVQGSNSDSDGFIRACPDRPWGPSNLPYNVYRRAKRPGRGVNPRPHVASWLKKECSYTSALLRVFVACYKLNFTFLSLRLFFLHNGLKSKSDM